MEERKIKLKKELEEAREHDRNYWHIVAYCKAKGYTTIVYAKRS